MITKVDIQAMPMNDVKPRKSMRLKSPKKFNKLLWKNEPIYLVVDERIEPSIRADNSRPGTKHRLHGDTP